MGKVDPSISSVVFPLTRRQSRAALMALALFLGTVFLLAFAVLLRVPVVLADPGSDGPLTVEIGAAYNLVVDSNAESPSTYAPAVATVMGTFCNTGTQVLTPVWAYIGDAAEDTPGLYPRRYVTDTGFDTQHPFLVKGVPGDYYAFTHLGGRVGLDDAKRYLGKLDPGECKVQYWHFTYPQCSNVDGAPDVPPCDQIPTWGDSVKPGDDLWLTFDIWATAEDQDGSYRATEARKMTMRNEISAMANKIEPNGNPAGQWFNTVSNTVAVGDIITSNGVYYRFGNVRHGFDNDGDFAPDYNAWAQPIGDPRYDPGCFRLIRTSGVLTVSRGGGNPDKIIEFTDQLYFTDLPPDNTNVVGNVYYTFEALGGPCETDLTPYQEVASGFDNEKFNGDYGAGVPPVVSEEPKVTLDKQGNITVTPGAKMNYTLAYSNTGDSPAGLTLASAPLVLSDTIPSNTELTGTIEAVGFTILYFVNGSYTTTQPADLSTVEHIQLWKDDTLNPNSGGIVTFTVAVASNPTEPFIENCAAAQFDGASPFAEDCVTTLISGTYTIGDWVWRDENNDGLQNDGATGIDDITVWLYWDENGNQAIDNGDRLLVTDTTVTSGTYGYYLFEYLPGGDYVVKVDESDSDLLSNYPGYRHTTPITYAVTLSPTNSVYLDADFGFGPSLNVEKTMLNDGAYEGQGASYLLTVRNQRPGGGTTVGSYCQYTVWASEQDTGHSEKVANKQWLNEANAFGEPDGEYAITYLANANDTLALSGFDIQPQDGNILSATLVIYADEAILPIDGHTIHRNLYFTDTLQTLLDITEYDFDGIVGSVDITTTNVPTAANHTVWRWSDFSNNIIDVVLIGDKGGGSGDLGIDAVGFQILADQPCSGHPEDVLTTVPLTDTYDTSRLRFVSASPAETSVDEVNGVITWADVGPIYPGGSKSVRVNFEALDLSAATEVSNTACSIVSSFSDGGLANTDCATATGTITPTGSITGVVWSDLAVLGWATDPTGYETTDYRIPNVTVQLYGCYDDDLAHGGGNLITQDTVVKNKTCEDQTARSEWRLVDTQVTDAYGYYAFDGLFDAFYYVQVDSTTLPGSPTQQAEADFDANGDGFSCSSPPGNNSCDHIWGDLAEKLQDNSSNNIFNPINAAETITNVNFGYSMPAFIYGTVWHDVDGDGTREDGEDGLDNPSGGITVTLTSSGGMVYTTTTDASGYYSFTNLAAGTYTVTVLAGTLPAPAASWSQTSETGPNQDGTLDSVMTTVDLVSGQVSGSYDFGYTQSGEYAIGDTVYYDWSGDGEQQTDTEEGIPGVLVVLYEDEDGDGRVDPATDARVMTAATTITGFYKFTGLVSGTYIVFIDRANSDTDYLPATYLQTQDPDVDPGVCDGAACDNRGSSTVSSTLTFDDSMDFGYRPTGDGKIGDTVWRDMNGDGEQAGPLETGIASVTVWLEVDLNGDGTYTRVATETTDADGKYLFENLPDAAYRVIVDTGDDDLPEDGYRQKYAPSTATFITTTISGGNTYLDADFGFMPPGAIGDTIYWDANRNGEYDRGEQGIEDVVVRLENTTVVTGFDGTRYEVGEYVLTATTTVTGYYLFVGLPTGPYVANYSVTVGTISGDPPLSGDPDLNGDSCLDIAPGDFFYPFCDGETNRRIRPGTRFLQADFGYVPSGVIGDYVWRDVDRNGEQDDGEPGIPGVLVIVTDGDTWTTTTDFDGRYSFANLPSGDTYTVEFQLPISLAGSLTPTVTSAGAIVGGVGSVGYTTTMVLDADGSVTSIEGQSCTAVTCSLHIDAGFVMNGAYKITGTIFYDVSGTGEYDDLYEDGADIPYGNITVYLWDESGSQIGETTTDANGHYTFTHLVNGDYTVSVSGNSPKLADLDLTASVNPGYTYNTVTIAGADEGDQDFGFFGAIDFGDLPSKYDNTRLSNEGARHIIGSLYLGSSVESDGDGQESDAADGDDDDGADDEDGIVYGLVWIRGSTATITATVTGNGGYLYAWFDWNNDGDFGDTDEQYEYGDTVAGENTFVVNIPSSAITVSMRFRLYEGRPAVISPLDVTTNGEVEDYQEIAQEPTAVTLSLFEAKWDSDRVPVTWETALEIDTVGFNVWRSTTPGGPYERLNDVLIPAESLGGVEGGFYEVVDTDVTPGVSYYYKLEELEVGDRTNWYGPTSTDGSNPTSVTSLNVAASSSVVGTWGAVEAVVVVSLPLVVLVRLRRRR